MTNKAPQPIASFLAHKDGTTSASFSPDGKSLATGGYDCVTRLWNTETWQEKQCLPGHRRGEVAFSPEGNRLISGGLHKDADVFDTSNWQVVSTLDHSGGVWALAFRPDGSQMILVEPDNTSEERSHRPIEFWDTREWVMTGTADVAMDNVYGMAFSAAGKFAALCHYPNGMVSILSADFTQVLKSFSAHDEATWGISFSPDGKLLATGGADNVARLWDTEAWEMQNELPHAEFREMKDYKNGVLCTAFSPDGKLLATGGLDGTLTMWRF